MKMTRASPCLSVLLAGRRAGSRLSALVLCGLLALASGLPASASAADAAPIVLQGRPSEWLVAPANRWQPVLQDVQAQMDARQQGWAQMSNAERIEWHVHATVIAQTQGRWQAAIDSVKAVRALQPSESGRQTAGLLNELLARQAMAKGDEAMLRALTRDTVLAMPWAEVEPAIRGIRAALVAMDESGIKAFVKGRMDLSTGITQGRVTLPFVMQLLGAHFQLQQVLPHRAALLTGLDDAISQRAPAVGGGPGGQGS